MGSRECSFGVWGAGQSGVAWGVVGVDGGEPQQAVSEQRTVQRLMAENRALEYELTAAKTWLGYQADHIARLEKANAGLRLALWLGRFSR